MKTQGPSFGTGLCLLFLCVSCASGGLSRQEGARLYYNLGNAYAELGRNSEAISAYEHAWQMDAELFSAGYNLARLHIAAGRFEEGMALLDILISRDPENALLLETQAWASYLAGDFDGALSIYREILAIQPQNQTALYNASRIMLKQEDWSAAAGMLRRVYDFSGTAAAGIPEKTSLLLEIAELEFRQGNEDEAMEALLFLQGEKPGFQVYRLLGDIYYSRELFSQALEAYNSALEHDSQSGDVLYKKALIYLLVLEDLNGGLELLGASLEAGFSDNAAFRRLLDESELLYASQVEELFTSKGVDWKSPEPEQPSEE